LLDLPLHPDPEHATQHCGTCTACLDACPTGALVEPGWLDARRCISYLTIELRSMVPDPLRSELANWVFGCDICQEVCPWNRKAEAATTQGFGDRADLEQLDLIEMLALNEEAFRNRFRDTALLRAGRTGLLRSCALVLGSQGDANALPALYQAEQDADPQIREAAAWASSSIKSRLDRQPG
jgi:epoxyqueuosine reductase